MWGEPQWIRMNNPAVATAATIVCPGQVVWHIDSISFDLVIDTTSGTRYPYVTVDNAAGLYTVACAAGYAATPPMSDTQTTRFTFAKGLGEWDASSTDYASGPMATIPVLGGQTIAARVDNIQANDLIENIVLLVRQYPVAPEPRENDPFDADGQGG
jgi:hypothetical protein